MYFISSSISCGKKLSRESRSSPSVYMTKSPWAWHWTLGCSTGDVPGQCISNCWSRAQIKNRLRQEGCLPQKPRPAQINGSQNQMQDWMEPGFGGKSRQTVKHNLYSGDLWWQFQLQPCILFCKNATTVQCSLINPNWYARVDWMCRFL